MDLKKAIKETIDYITDDFKSWPLRFVIEVIGWLGSVSCAFIMTLTLPHPPLLLLYFIWIVSASCFGWSAWTRGSFGLIANYALLISVDTVGLARLLFHV